MKVIHCIFSIFIGMFACRLYLFLTMLTGGCPPGSDISNTDRFLAACVMTSVVFLVFSVLQATQKILVIVEYLKFFKELTIKRE